MLDWKSRRLAECALDAALARDEQERAPDGKFGTGGSAQNAWQHKQAASEHKEAHAHLTAKGNSAAAAAHATAHKAHSEASRLHAAGSTNYAAAGAAARHLSGNAYKKAAG